MARCPRESPRRPRKAALAEGTAEDPDSQELRELLEELLAKVVARTLDAVLRDGPDRVPPQIRCRPVNLG